MRRLEQWVTSIAADIAQVLKKMGDLLGQTLENLLYLLIRMTEVSITTIVLGEPCIGSRTTGDKQDIEHIPRAVMRLANLVELIGLPLNDQLRDRNIHSISMVEIPLQPGFQMCLPLKQGIERLLVGVFFQLLEKIRPVLFGHSHEGTTKKNGHKNGENKTCHETTPLHASSVYGEKLPPH